MLRLVDKKIKASDKDLPVLSNLYTVQSGMRMGQLLGPHLLQ